MEIVDTEISESHQVFINNKLPSAQISCLLESILADKNSYWRDHLTVNRIWIEHQEIIDGFLNHFSMRGYSMKEAVSIDNNGIDNSVYFIGAPISVLKPYILNQNIPSPGICMHQGCIRTKNTKTVLDDSVIPPWGSCFSWLATLTPFEERKRLLQDAIIYFLEVLKIPRDQIRIQISSADSDLVNLLQEIECPIGLVFDEKPSVYYTHKYWMGEIVGRNFNFVLREKESEKFNDIGNYIFIENGEKKHGVELALGTSVIMKELFELEHLMDTSIISWIFCAEKPLMRKFQDCIVSAVLLYRLWVRPNASNTKGRVLRSYLEGVVYFQDKFGISPEKLLWWIQHYELLEYWINTDVADFIANYTRKM